MTAARLSPAPPPEEWRRLTETCAFLRPAGWSLLEVRGKDSADYLHRRLSQSIRDMPSGSGAPAAQLDADGRMIHEYLVHRIGDRFDLLIRTPWAAEAADLIEKFVFTEDVAAGRETLDWPVAAAAGPLAPEVLTALGVPESALGPSSAAEIRIAGETVRLYRDAQWRLPHFRLAMPEASRKAVDRALGAEIERAGGGPAGAEAFDALRLREGIPEFGRDVLPGAIPLEAGMAGHVHFDKGCYAGQETIARMVNLGHPARVMVRLTAPPGSEIEPGAAISAGGQPAGAVTSARALPEGGPTLALGSLKWRFRGEGTVSLAARGGEVPAEAIALTGGVEYRAPGRARLR